MNSEEVEKEHNLLNLKIKNVLHDFVVKHTDDDGYIDRQASFIIQSVLNEYQSNIEYQSGRAAPFTTRQIDHICYQIGEWYLMMKPLLEVQHNLGYMKERLKTMICGD